jgi:hypothetical protein
MTFASYVISFEGQKVVTLVPRELSMHKRRSLAMQLASLYWRQVPLSQLRLVPTTQKTRARWGL